MTDEDMADIRERLAWSFDQEYAEDWRIRPDDVDALLAEVERLRAALEIARDNHAVTMAHWEASKAENAAMREIVAPVAYGRVMEFPWADGSTTPVLFHVGTDWTDLKTKARVVLAREGGQP